MSFNEGPSPQEIFEGIKLEEAQRNKGHLKIFFGMAAGVGKTYAMLEEAQMLMKEQIDIVVGNIEAHQRKEIEVLLSSLPQIPKKTVIYKDKEFKELDVEAIISLRPSIVLVDELAHSNLPGSKNEKRWQDVQEILDHGISVHTTLNVQHIESLKDIIFGITDIAVTETIPDIIIEKAHAIQLIDLTPDELLQRMKEGKVYAEEQSKIATIHFFQKNKLAALREIVLRYVADKIDIDLMCMVTSKEGRIEWKTHEKFLVAISQNPQSQKLIKATRRLAAHANTSWLAVYVNTGSTLEKKDEEQLEKFAALTRALGSELITINDPDIAEGIKRVAYQRDITHIILGRSPRNLMLSLFQGPTLVDRLSAECKNIDLHVIKQEKYTPSSRMKWPSYSWRSKISDYLLASVATCLLASLSWVALSLIGYRVVEFLFFLSVSAFSIIFKQGPSAFAAILFGFIWGFFFTPSAESSFSKTEDGVLLALYVLTAISFGFIVERSRKQKELLRKGNEEASHLNEILSVIHSNLGPHDILRTLEERLPKVVEGIFKFVLKNNAGILDMEAASTLVSTKERMTANWAFQNNHEAGWSTDTLPLSENLYVPLKGLHEMMGILVYRPPENRKLTKEERHLIDSLCQQLSNHLEKTLGIEIKPGA